MIRLIPLCITCTLISFFSPFSAHSDFIPAESFNVPEGLEVSVWATSPLFYNPTNMDVDKDGRIWVTEAVNYRSFKNKMPLSHKEGDRVVIVEDTNGDGVADSSHVFVQDNDLVAPLGIAVIGNRILVASAPHMILYTDVDNNRVFDPKIDKKELWLTGFGGLDHDHSLHSITAGPDGWLYFNVGNAGPHIVTDKSGWTLRSGSVYNGGTPYMGKNKPKLVSDDGRIWTGGIAFRIRPDGTGLEPIGHNFRNSYEQTLTSFGDVFQNDNDDPPASRTTWLMEYGNLGFFSEDGSRTWQSDQRPGQSVPIAEWRQEDPGTIPAGDVYGSGAPCGIVYYENGALPKKYNGLLLSCESAMRVVYGYLPKPKGAGFELERFNFLWPKKDAEKGTWFRPSDVSVGTDGAIYVADWYDPGVGGHSMNDKTSSGTIYRIAPKGTKLNTPRYDLSTTKGQIETLKSPAGNVRYLGFEKLARQSKQSHNQLKKFMRDEPSPYLSSRAVWLLAQSPKGARTVQEMLSNAPDAQQRVVALRALRRAGHSPVELAKISVQDQSQAVRREAMLALRDVPFESKKGLLSKFAEGYDGKDPWYLEAFGTACENNEADIYTIIFPHLGNKDPLKWDARFEGLAWRLHPPAAAKAFTTRATASSLSDEMRKRALVGLAFVDSKEAALSMVDLANNGPEDIQFAAAWWAHHPHHDSWRALGVASQVQNFPDPTKTISQNPKDFKKFKSDMKDHLVYSTDVLTKHTLADIDVNIEGAHEMYLVVDDGGDGNSHDWANWIQPQIHIGQRKIGLSRMPWESASSGWGRVNINMDTTGGKLGTAAGVSKNGIGTHANSIIKYNLQGKNALRFTSKVGIDDDKMDQPASIRFQVYTVTPKENIAQQLPPIKDIENIKGNHARGKTLFAGRGACAACHTIENKGGKIGPDLTGIGKKATPELLIKSIVEPSADISLGFDTWSIVTKDNQILTGYIEVDGDPIVFKGPDGIPQRIAKSNIKKRTKSPNSIMLSAEQLQLSGQDVADLVAYISKQ